MKQPLSEQLSDFYVGWMRGYYACMQQFPLSLYVGKGWPNGCIYVRK